MLKIITLMIREFTKERNWPDSSSKKSRRGKESLEFVVSSGERGMNTTAVCCVSAGK